MLVKGSFDKSKEIEELKARIELLKSVARTPVQQINEKKTYMFS